MRARLSFASLLLAILFPASIPPRAQSVSALADEVAKLATKLAEYGSEGDGSAYLLAKYGALVSMANIPDGDCGFGDQVS